MRSRCGRAAGRRAFVLVVAQALQHPGAQARVVMAHRLIGGGAIGSKYRFGHRAVFFMRDRQPALGAGLRLAKRAQAVTQAASPNMHSPVG